MHWPFKRDLARKGTASGQATAGAHVKAPHNTTDGLCPYKLLSVHAQSAASTCDIIEFIPYGLLSFR